MIKNENIEGEILSWKRFKNGIRWSYITKQLNAVILESEKIIKTPGADNEKKYTDRDLHIIRQQLAQELIDYPERYIMMLDGTFQQPEENDDAFMSMYGDDADDPAVDNK